MIKVKILAVGLAISCGLLGCQSTSTIQDAATANDMATEATLIALCSPLRLPALYRKYAQQPEKLNAVTVLCGPEPET